MMEVQGPLSLSIITPLTKESHSLPISFFGSMREEEDEDEDDDNEADAEQSNIAKKTKKVHSDASLVASLKACTQQKDLAKGIKIHAHTVKRGLFRNNHHITSAIVNMYAKCGALLKAQETFDDISSRNTVLWTSLIAGYAQHGYGEEALMCFECMQEEGFLPDVVTFLSVLRACGSLGYAHKGKRIHALIVKKDGVLEKNVIIGNALVDMYVKCGSMKMAQEVFDEIPFRDTILWTTLIAGYAQHGLGLDAFKCFEEMQYEGFSPNAATYVCVLKACSIMELGAEKGREIHREIAKDGLLGKNALVGNSLIDMYAKHGHLEEARKVFDEIVFWDVCLWNTLITGYAQHGYHEAALSCFEEMQQKGVSPDPTTFICILKVCGAAGWVKKGQEIHSRMMKEGFVQKKDLMLANAVVDMYAKCGAFSKAREVFDELPNRNVITWNALMTGYNRHGHGKEVLECFEQLAQEGLSANEISYVCILKACTSIGAFDKGQEIYFEVVRKGLLKKNILISNAIVDMLAKCGALVKAQQIFDELPRQDVILWTTLISGYAQHGYYEEALDCFERMQDEGISPNTITLSCILKACGDIGAADNGQQIHSKIVIDGLEKDGTLSNALIDMYAKCGKLSEAKEVFYELPSHDVVCWTLLMTGYCQLGKDNLVFSAFHRMIEGGIVPDLIIFSIILNACCHSGRVIDGQMYFSAMNKTYGIIPTLEHYTCMVDLFARAGFFEQAIKVIDNMPCSVDLTVWHTLLGACREWGNVNLGRLAFENAIQLDGWNAAAYLCMSNIYAAAGMQEEAKKVESMRLQRGAETDNYEKTVVSARHVIWS